MAGFIRRFGYFPGNEVITQIEGVVIVDLPPPGSVEGTDTGVACLVGEFSDMTYCCKVDGTGAVTQDVRPQEIFGSTDMLNKVGGWDETLGDFGDSEGNGFVALRSKRYSRLLLAPVFLASNYGCRFWRELPLCTAVSNPLPVVPVVGGAIAAGREFRSASGGRLRVASRVVFTGKDVITSGTGGSTTAAAAAATQNFTVAGADFSAIVRPDGGVGIKKGDIVVIGYNNAGARSNVDAGTWRVAADATSGAPTVLSLQKLDGTNFAFLTASPIPYRIHVSSDADSAPVFVVGATTAGGYAANDAGGASVPVRPLTNFSGAAADGVWTANAPLTPRDVPTAMTGSSWDPLSSLAGKVHPTQTPAFTQAVQAPNAVAHASIDALYTTALAATISDLAPVSDINLVWCARTSATIRSQLKQNALNASSSGKGRCAIVSPDLDALTTSAILGDVSPGVGATRDERVFYTWPGAVIYIPEAVNYRLKTADGLTTIDGNLDTKFDSFLVSILSVLPPERNPGQAQQPIPTVLAPVVGMQRGVSKLEMNDYIALRSRGVAALRLDRTVGPVIQSGVTSSLVSGQKNINRRRMADFIQDSLAQRLVQYAKLPLSDGMKDNSVGEVIDFMESLLSTKNPAAARIRAYNVDDKNGNTPESEAEGIFVIITRARLTPTGDFIVLQTEVGNNVVTTTELAAA